ncbi:MAG: restriction endonuclease subunit S [Bacillota bacterium]
MSKLQTTSFETVLEDSTKFGTKIPKERYLSVGLYPIIDQGKEYIAGYTNSDNGLFENIPAIIFGDHTRTLKYIDFPCYLGADGVKLLTVRNYDFDCKYLYYFLKNVKIIDAGYNRHYKWLKEVMIPVEAKERQKRIATELDKITDLISKRKSQLEKLDLLIKSKFTEMFGAPILNVKQWKIVCVEDVVSVFVGIVIKPSLYYSSTNSGIKAFRSLNVGEMNVENKDWVYFTEESNKLNKKTILEENDVLIVRTGAPGRACVVKEPYVGCNAIDVIIARAQIERVNPYYLCAFTNFDHGKLQINDGIGGAAQQHFNVGKYKKINLYLPPIELQNQFAEYVARVEQTKEKMQAGLEQLETLYKARMQEYFG